jgi:8-oxo-dGTP pyrophosphatase MutT (NUDIX family)
MHWRVHSEEQLYLDEWLDIKTVDVELPGGQRLNHRLLRIPPYAGVVMADSRQRVLLLWRHRFITGSWGWEIPGGRVEAGEQPAVAAAREAEEETGWRPGRLRPLLYGQPANGISDAEQHVFLTDEATHVGPPSDPAEAASVEWVPLADVPRLIADRAIVSNVTMAALLYALVTR